jgi:hypothetical protein
MNPSDFILLILSLGFAPLSLLAHGWTLNGIGPAALSTAAGIWQLWMQSDGSAERRRGCDKKRMRSRNTHELNASSLSAAAFTADRLFRRRIHPSGLCVNCYYAESPCPRYLCDANADHHDHV